MWPCSPPTMYIPHTLHPPLGLAPNHKWRLLSLLSRDGQHDVAETVGVSIILYHWPNPIPCLSIF